MQRVYIKTSPSGRRYGWIKENGRERRIPIKEAEMFNRLQTDWVGSIEPTQYELRIDRKGR